MGALTPLDVDHRGAGAGQLVKAGERPPML
jgi:hypothetical protein